MSNSPYKFSELVNATSPVQPNPVHKNRIRTGDKYAYPRISLFGSQKRRMHRFRTPPPPLPTPSTHSPPPVSGPELSPLPGPYSTWSRATGTAWRERCLSLLRILGRTPCASHVPRGKRRQPPCRLPRSSRRPLAVLPRKCRQACVQEKRPRVQQQRTRASRSSGSWGGEGSEGGGVGGAPPRRSRG